MPANMAQPLKIWSKFSVTKGPSTLKFRLVEPTRDRIQDVADLLVNHFVQDESTAKAVGISKSEEAMEEYKYIMSTYLNDEDLHIVVCCLDSDNNEIGEIVGGSIMALTKKDKPFEIEFQPKTETMQKFLKVIVVMMKMYDVPAEQNVDKYYDGRGIIVHSNYRGLGIAYELVKTRRRICQELGVPLTAALMTAYGTQKAAKRDGWETVFEFNFAEFGKEFNISYDENGPPTAKLMVARA